MTRRMSLGSSDVPAILGIARPTASEPDSQWKVWDRIVYGSGSADTNATRRGRIIEPALRGWYCSEYSPGRDIRLGPPIGADPIYGREGWTHARPDMLEPGAMTIEIKTTRTFDQADGWGPDESDEAPASVIVQADWQMMVTEVPRADLVAFCPMSDDIRVYHIERDAEREAAILDACRAWWARHIINNTPPPVDGSSACASVLARRWTTEKGRDRPATDAEIELIQDIANTSAVMKRLKNYLDVKKAELASRIQDNYALTSGGKNAVIYYPVAAREVAATTRKATRVLRVMMEPNNADEDR